jgi:hypothetical protein
MWIANRRRKRNAETVVRADPARLMPFEVTVATKRVTASSNLFMRLLNEGPSLAGMHRGAGMAPRLESQSVGPEYLFRLPTAWIV